MARKDPQFSQDGWRVKLQSIFQGVEEPSLELLTRIDTLLAKPAKKQDSGKSDALLF